MELFWQNCLIAVKQVVILYIIVAGGYICDKTGVFTEKTARACNNLLFYVITPCVIVNSFMTTEFTADTAKGLLLAACCGALTNTTGILLSLPFFRDRKKPTNAVFKFASVYGNMGYMALPLANAVLGPEGVFYCSAGIMMFQVFCFTHGVWVMSRDGDTNAKFEAKHLFLNPGVIAVCIGLPLFLLKVKVPELFNKPVSFVGSMNTPLAMLMLGTYMSNAGMKTVFKNKEQYLVAKQKNEELRKIGAGFRRAVHGLHHSGQRPQRQQYGDVRREIRQRYRYRGKNRKFRQLRLGAYDAGDDRADADAVKFKNNPCNTPYPML